MIDEILEALNDGKIHSLKDIMDYIRCHHHTPIPSEHQVKFCLTFLFGFDFVDGTNDSGYCLDKRVQEFLKRVKWIEKVEA